jgi:hypothetical protein
MFQRCRLLVAAVALALLAVPSIASASIVTNGDFETGNLSGWQEDYLDPIAGHWFNYTGGMTSPIEHNPLPAPPQGTHAAITDQGDVSRQILYQDLTIPPGGSVNDLSLLAYYEAGMSPDFESPDTLAIDVPNEQYRIDLMNPSAPLDSVASGDVLRNLLQTTDASPGSLPPTQLTADLSPYAGQTVRLRFAVPVTEHTLNAGVDAVSVKSNGFSIGIARRNKKKGIAKLPITVPDAGSLKITGKGVVGKARLASKSVQVPAGTATLLIKPNGKTRRKLDAKGKAKVRVSITYKPKGTIGNTQKLKLKLEKKRKKK